MSLRDRTRALLAGLRRPCEANKTRRRTEIQAQRTGASQVSERLSLNCSTGQLARSFPRSRLPASKHPHSRAMFGEFMRMHKTLPAILAIGAMPFAAAAQEAAVATHEPATIAQVVSKVVEPEQSEMNVIRKYSPLVETYIQTVRPDKDLGSIPDGDRYFLGRAELDKGVQLQPLITGNGRNGNSESNVKTKFLAGIGNIFSAEFLPRGFLQMIY